MGTVVTTELIAEMAEKKWKNPTIFSGRRGVLPLQYTRNTTAVLPNVVFQYEYVPLLYTAAVHALYSTTAVPNTYYD